MINSKKGGGLAKVITACLLVMLASTIVRAENMSYFVDAAGNDGADGRSEESPWRTLNRVNSVTFGPGDRLLFKAGQRWEGQLKLQGSGSAQAPIRVGRYGKGKAPHIAGDGKKDATVLLENSSHWVIEDLEVTNTIPGEKRRNRMKGVSVEANSGGVFKNITLRRLHVHHVSGDWDRQGGSGIWVGATADAEDGSARKSRYDGVLIEDCYVHDVSFYAIMFSGWENRFRDKRWFPSTNVVVRNNFTSDSGGDCIVVICCDKPLIENNEGHRAAIGQSRGGKTHAAGMWPHSCDGMVMRYNKVVGIDAKKDGQAFDVDINCRNTLIEYNWSQGNRSGFLLLCSPSLNVPGTYGITVRNNLSIDDGEQKGLFTFVSDVRDVTIQNNAFLNSFSGPHNLMSTWRPKENKGWKTDVLFEDNLFSTPGRKVFKAESWVAPTFKGNTYAGDYQGMPADATGINTKHPAVQIKNGKVGATSKRSSFEPFDISKAGLLQTSSWIKQRDESLKRSLAGR